MGKEIEKKFLVIGDEWRGLGTGVLYRQGYLSTEPERTVRVRVVGAQAFLTVKGITRGATRAEFEYEIPLHDAEEMLDTLCKRPLIEKVRYEIEFAGHLWEVDEFIGENRGLIVAELELDEEDRDISFPHWIGAEVTSDARYFNANLIAHPFSQWEKK